jgi:hypothetical protein
LHNYFEKSGGGNIQQTSDCSKVTQLPFFLSKTTTPVPLILVYSVMIKVHDGPTDVESRDDGHQIKQ